ncbi:hypothetical protein B0O80DRAFT_493722 [Mortierella sp. GBAus27b]|nr:hypothetical protein BGX31_006725 [Mortierella sp. GBA43]KAI8361119.1 hypothetical protein B0O80DRAFT_493722 [Mortierella sp. GBAus27b]
MNPSQPGKATDKENDVLAEAASARGVIASHATLAKQSSLQGLKAGLTRTASQQGKITPQTANSPVAPVLRTKTNFQQTPAVSESLKDAPTKKSTLARTFSATFESNTSGNAAPNTPIHSEARRRSLTRRGSTKSRLIVHKDGESLSLAPLEGNESIDKDNDSNTMVPGTKSRDLLVKGAPIETVTTLLSIERSITSDDKVVVGAADAKTKRRALTNDEDYLSIEYCPPPVEEQPFDPGFEIDDYALSVVPPANAYRLGAIDMYEIGLPAIELAPIERPPSTDNEEEQKPGSEEECSMPKAAYTSDGRLEFTWSDDEDDEGLHPKGGRCFGIKDLHDSSKTQPPFDGFIFDVEGSEDSLSEDEDDILGAIQTARHKGQADKDVDEFNKAFGLDDLDDESKMAPAFTDFTFEV